MAAEVEAAALVPLSGSLQDVVKLAAPDLVLDHQIHKRWEGDLRESLLNHVRSMLEPIQNEVDELSKPKAIRNDLSNVIHLVRTSIHTQCGWMLADHLDKTTPTQLDAEGFWCKNAAVG